MKIHRLLPIALISLAAALSGCESMQTTLAGIPANSFDKIEVGLTVGPFSHVTTLIGGEKQSDGSLKIRSAFGGTSVMGWGSHVEIENLTIIPAGALPIPAMPPVILTPAPLVIPPKGP